MGGGGVVLLFLHNRSPFVMQHCKGSFRFTQECTLTRLVFIWETFWRVFPDSGREAKPMLARVCVCVCDVCVCDCRCVRA